MFKQLSKCGQGGITAADIVQLRPAELTVLLELAWERRVNPPAGPPPPESGHPDRRSDIPAIRISAIPGIAGRFEWMSEKALSLAQRLMDVNERVRWHHLIYAYMVENTRIYEIFRRVVHEFLHGEKLGAPSSPETQRWLRNTEELFYRDTPSFSITSLSSHIRPDLRASRRNAYQRLFGMELNHGNDDNSPYSYTKGAPANDEFISTFEELLREVWVGYVNRKTSSGANPTDDAKIGEVTKKLEDMLLTRRQGGNLSREEFFFVSMMSWFHMTVDSAELEVIKDLRATGHTADQRLLKIAEVVGLPAHGLSRSYFEIAEALSTVLLTIESGVLSKPDAAPAFYNPDVPNSLSGTMNTIITHWSLITGRDMKARKIATA